MMKRHQSTPESSRRLAYGLTEGHINRLKTLKRAIYGRAKFDLLKIRAVANTTIVAGLKR
jgi:hypothetical protein